MSNRTEKYVIRLDNSVCDIVTLRTPHGCFEKDGTTPKSRDWVEKCFPGRQGVVMAHINPADTTGRKVYVYMNAEQQNECIGQEELDYSDFKLTPLILHEKITKDNWRRHIIVTELTNLRYVTPNIVKRTKILGDGKTNVMLRDMSKLMLPLGLKQKLENFDYSKREEDSIPEKKEMGLVTEVAPMGRSYPVKVVFPGVGNFFFETEDLMCFHEVED